MLIKKSDQSLDEACEGMGTVFHIPVPVGIIKAGRSLVTFAYNSLTCCKKKPVKLAEVPELSTAIKASENPSADSQAADPIVNTEASVTVRVRTSPYPLRSRTAAKYYTPS